MSKLLVLLLAAVLLSLSVAGPVAGQVGNYPTPVRSESAMVVSARAEASEAGLAALRAGGNAVDAAVAAAFTLAVVHPMAGNLGGGGFMVIRFADGRATTIDFRETAPAAATAGMYLDDAGEVIEGLSTRGYLASGVPGTVAGLLLAHERYGRLPRADLLGTPIRLADEGFVITRDQAERLNRFRFEFAAFPSAQKYFVKPDGSPFEAGDRIVQADLARVLERIANEGRDGFYRGETAAMVEAEMERGGGLITTSDLASYRAIERPPITGAYRGHRIISMGPPSSGGITLLQVLHALEPFRVDSLGHNSSATIHLAAEAMRRAYADRSRWLGDPGFIDVPVSALVDPEYVRARMADFDPDSVSGSSAIVAGTPPGTESTETTHLSVVDDEGNAVSLTTTLNAWYGSKVVVDGAGFFLNNEMDDFSARPGTPDLYGLVSGEANAIAPGKRMVSSMTPTIVEDPDGRLLLVLGTPGGSTIITTAFQIISNVIDHRMNVQQAVLAPRIHHQWRPDTLFFESRGLARDVVRNLERRGWLVQERFGTTGRAYAIMAAYESRNGIAGGLSGSEVEGGTPLPASGLAGDADRRVLFGGLDPRGRGAAAAR